MRLFQAWPHFILAFASAALGQYEAPHTTAKPSEAPASGDVKTALPVPPVPPTTPDLSDPNVPLNQMVNENTVVVPPKNASSANNATSPEQAADAKPPPAQEK